MATRYRSFPLWLPSGVAYWTVVDERYRTVEAADEFLLTGRLGRDLAEGTTQAYATSLALFFQWCAATGVDWGRRAGIWAGSCSGCSTTTPTADGRRRPRRRCAARAGLHFAECRQDVEPDQVVVPLARGVLQLHDLQPLRDRLADGDGGLWVPVLVDLALKLGQRDFGGVVRLCGLAEVPRLAGQRVHAGVHDCPERTGRQLLNMAAGAASAAWHVRDDS